MRKGKRRRPDARRWGSSSKNTSSQSTPQDTSYDSPPQPSGLQPTPLNPGSDTSSQPTSLESSPQNSTPPNLPTLPDLPAPQDSAPTQSFLPVDQDARAASPAKLSGRLMHVGPSCACVPCPGSSTCWHHPGQCHGRIHDALMPRDWHPLSGRGIPSLLTIYRF
ncbi:PREDICTED: spermatogenesis-associated protein 3 [Elephantulus edwardii]|uniref:spermatogenesis-associated protein 3 n=1 Tax=Elephantulus edwardii TaxID=28737 RepID=UPI0003F062BB|nr:PREDICTED: spermatogenesis-associated protein 3 [Elephantulus edwardii]